MTTVELNSASKTRLISYIEELKQQNAQTEQNLRDMTAYANFFNNIIQAIEKILVDSPFISQDGKFFKKLMWVMTNMDKIKKLIEDIAEAVKRWRQTINELAAKQAEAQQTNSSPA